VRATANCRIFPRNLDAKVTTNMQYGLLLAAKDDNIAYYIIGVAVLFLAGLVFLAIFARYFSLWIQCKMTGAGISLLDLVMMSFRKVNTPVIVRSKIMAVQARLTDVYPITTRSLEAHCLAGGNVPRVIQSLI